MSNNILDPQWGQPYETSLTPVIKTEANKPITDEIASAATDVYNFQGWLPIMENPDEVLNLEAGGDITLYDKIGTDPRAAANLRTRAKAVVGREWQIVPYSQETADIQAAEYADAVFKKFPYDLCRRPALRGGILKGFAVSEVMWDYSEGDTFINNIYYRHQRRFKFAPNGDLHLFTLGNPYPGINATIDTETGLPLRKFQVFTFGDEVTSRYGCGLGKELYWPWFFKRQDIQFWLKFVEKFASPTVAGEYPPGTDPKLQNVLLSAAASVHSNSAITYPQGMNLRLIEAARGGNISSYKELADFCNDEMTICILGQLATTGGQPGKLGNSQEQEAVYLDYIKDDADSLCEAQNDRKHGVIPWLIDYQFPKLGRYPQVQIKCGDEEDGKTIAERDKTLSEALSASNLKLSRSYYVRNHGLEEDDLEDQTKPLPDPSLDKGGSKDPAFADCPHCHGLSFAEGDQDPVDAITAQALDQADTAPLVEQIYRHLSEARDFTAALDGLPDLRRRLKIDTIAKAIGDACAVANLTGRADVLDEVSSGSDPQFADATSLPFDEAITFFRQKTGIKTATWTDLWQGEHSRAFTVAGVLRDDMLGDFREAIDSAIADGATYDDFLKKFDTIVETYGWDYNGARGWRSRVIYDTNVRTSYNAGRWAQQTDPDLLKLNPYLTYRHGDSVHPRPVHLSWNGTTLPANDPWWQTHYTPNGWGCKCRVVSTGKRDLASMGKTGPDTAPNNGTYEWVDKKSGEIHDVPVGIDPGWAYNPGEAWFNPATGKTQKI